MIQVCCNTLGSAILPPMPFISPVTEWHPARVAAKYDFPASGFPTTIVSAVMRETSYPPTLKLWINAAISETCVSLRFIFGIPSRPSRTTFAINSPS
jgi:hypothetical protein